MRSTMKVFSIVFLFALFATVIPADAAAATAVSCTDQYAACINRTQGLKEPYLSMADLECGLEYTGCVASKLKFW